MEEADFVNLAGQVRQELQARLSRRLTANQQSIFNVVQPLQRSGQTGMPQLQQDLWQPTQELSGAVRQLRVDLRGQGFPAKGGRLNAQQTQQLLPREQRLTQALVQLQPTPLDLASLQLEVTELLAEANEILVSHPLIRNQSLSDQQPQQMMDFLEGSIYPSLVNNYQQLQGTYQDATTLIQQELDRARQPYALDQTALTRFPAVQHQGAAQQVSVGEGLFNDFELYEDNLDQTVSQVLDSHKRGEESKAKKIKTQVQSNVTSMVFENLQNRNLWPAPGQPPSDLQKHEMQQLKTGLGASLQQLIREHFRQTEFRLTGNLLAQQLQDAQRLRSQITNQPLTSQQQDELIIGLVQSHQKFRSTYEQMVPDVPKWVENVVARVGNPAPRPQVPLQPQSTTLPKNGPQQQVKTYLANFLSAQIKPEISRLAEREMGNYEQQKPDLPLSAQERKQIVRGVEITIKAAVQDSVLEKLATHTDPLVLEAARRTTRPWNVPGSGAAVGNAIWWHATGRNPDLLSKTVDDVFEQKRKDLNIPSNIETAAKAMQDQPSNKRSSSSSKKKKI